MRPTTLFVTALAALALPVLPGPASAADVAGSSYGPDSVVATQGSATVTLGELDVYAATAPDDIRADIFASPERIANVLHNLLSQAQLLNEARAMGLQNDPQVKAAMQAAAEGALIEARMNRFEKDVASRVPDMSQLAHERYLAHPKKYAVQRQVDVKHILITAEDRTEEEAKALADKLYAKLQADPSKFAAFVTEYSGAPARKSNHGLISNATSTQYVRNFRQAAEKLDQVGGLIGPVKTQFGYHILKAVKIVPAHQRSFADIKDKLTKKLEQEWIAKTVQHHLDALRNKKVVVPDPEILGALQTRYTSSDWKHDGAKAGSSDAQPVSNTASSVD